MFLALVRAASTKTTGLKTYVIARHTILKKKIQLAKPMSFLFQNNRKKLKCAL